MGVKTLHHLLAVLRSMRGKEAQSPAVNGELPVNPARCWEQAWPHILAPWQRDLGLVRSWRSLTDQR